MTSEQQELAGALLLEQNPSFGTVRGGESPFAASLMTFCDSLSFAFGFYDRIPLGDDQRKSQSDYILRITNAFLGSLIGDKPLEVNPSLGLHQIKPVFLGVPVLSVSKDEFLCSPVLYSPKGQGAAACAAAPAASQKPTEEKQAEGTRMASRKSFHTSFVLLEYLNLLYLSLCSCAYLWIQGTAAYYSPYLAIVNASMMGKSRMVSELWRKGVFIFTICLRTDAGGLLDPPRTHRVANWLTEQRNLADPGTLIRFTNQICLFFLHSLTAFKLWLAGKQISAGPPRQKLDRMELARNWASYLTDGNIDVWGPILDQVTKDALANRQPTGTSAATDPVLAHIISAATSGAQAPEVALAGLSRTDAEEDAKRAREAAKALAALWSADIAAVQAQIRALLASPSTAEIRSTAAAGPKDKKTAAPPPPLDVLFFVDEARNLGTAGFFALRRSLKCFPTTTSKLSMFCTVLDTSSRISNFSPVLGSDPSLRDTLAGDLFPPFCHVMTLDLWWHAAAAGLPAWTSPATSSQREVKALLVSTRALVEVPKLPSTHSDSQASSSSGSDRASAESMGVTVQMVQEFEFNLYFGRPFFYPFFVHLLPNMESMEDADLKAARESVLKLALCKLMNSTEVDLNKRVSVEAPGWQDKALAVASVLLALEICPKSETAATLAASFMRPIAAISNDRDQVFTLTTAEPLIALIGRILVEKGVVTWDLMMQSLLAEEFKAPVTMVGFRGEVAGQILLQAAWQTAVTRLEAEAGDAVSEFPVISAYDFLDCLLGKQLVQQAETMGVLSSIPDDGDTRTGFQRFLEDADFSMIFPKKTTRSSDDAWRAQVQSQLESLVGQLLDSGFSNDLMHNASPLFGVSASKDRVLEVLELFCTYWTLGPLCEKLEGGLVRLNQFVKTFSPPSLELLHESFIRGAGIYCMEQQPITDLLVSVSFPDQNGVCGEASTSFVSVQIKLQREFHSLRVKEAWLDTVSSLQLTAADSPFVAIYLEFGHFEDYARKPGSVAIRPVFASSNAQSGSLGSGKLRNSPKRPRWADSSRIAGFGIFTKRPRLSEILTADRFSKETDSLFGKILVSQVDPSCSAMVSEQARSAVKQMFKDLTYLKQ